MRTLKVIPAHLNSDPRNGYGQDMFCYCYRTL